MKNKIETAFEKSKAVSILCQQQVLSKIRLYLRNNWNRFYVIKIILKLMVKRNINVDGNNFSYKNSKESSLKQEKREGHMLIKI